MKLFSKVATAFVGIAMAIGVGVAVTGSNEVKNVEATAGDTITYTITQSSVTGYPSAYSDTETTWSQNNDGGTISMSFALANHMKSNSSMQSKASVGYFRNTSVPTGYAIKSIAINMTSGKTARPWSFYGDSAEITSTSGKTAITTVSTNIDVAYGTGTTYDPTNYPYTYFRAQRGSNAYYADSYVITLVELGSSASTMVVKDSSGNTSPYNMTYGPSGRLLYAYESDGSTQITSGVTWTSSNTDILVLTTDYADNHVWVKCGTKVGEATVTASKSGYNSVVSTFTVSPGTVSSLAITGSMTRTNYKVNDNWDPTGFEVTATYDSGFVADVTSEAVWTYNPATATSTSVTSVTATASFGGQSATSSAQSVTVAEGVTYNLANNFSTYAAAWTTGYGDHTVSSTDVGASVSATMAFKITNKQSSGVGSAYPCIGNKTSSELTCLTFTLTAPDLVISSIDIVFVTRYTKTYPSFYLHKGSGIVSEALSSLTISGSTEHEQTLSTNNLNDTTFTVGYNAHQTTDNGAVGIKSISVGLVTPSAFGDVDHISVTTQPNVVYHVGETFYSTGMVVKAFDGADEATANFMDVTSEVKTQYRSGDYVFDESNVPGGNMWIEYTDEESNHFYTDLYLYVYALAEYELVTSEPADWSGNYLIVGTNASSELAAMNGALSNPDVEAGYKVVTDVDGTIQAGQELEWTIAEVTGGYSIQGKGEKYIGSLAAKSNGMLVSETPLVNTLSNDGSATTIVGTNTYHLAFNTTGDRFRYYASGTVQLYKLKQSSHADEYAQTFLGAFTCDASGETAPSFNIKEGETYWSWSLLADEYDTLTAVEKEEFRLGVPSETGDNVAQAIARYDYVVAKYGYSNFMSRTITPLRNIGTPAIDPNSTNTAIIVVSVIAVISVSSIGVLLVLKRRKNHI